MEQSRADAATCAARAIAEEVQQDAIRSKLPQVQALACADLAAAYSELGMPIEALQADYEAFRLTQDPAQRMRTLGNVGTDLVHLRSYDAARTAFTIVARSDAKATVRLNAVLELMGIEAAVGDRTAFEATVAPQPATAIRCRQAWRWISSSRQVGTQPVWRAARARAALCEAQAVAEKRGLHAWEFRVEQASHPRHRPDAAAPGRHGHHAAPFDDRARRGGRAPGTRLRL